ncbi:MAG: Coenzyme F420 hydrogenase/dehydrogenase, beta subunit C-terminal domain [Thermodesulfobacteriota bacterium]|jgi:coenzyme F420 hydrogenase subunit beta
MSGTKGPADLEREVLKEKLCTACGACVGLCPYFSTVQGRVVMTDSCNLPQGRCHAFCPRTKADMRKLRSVFFKEGQFIPELGSFLGLSMTRASDENIRAGSQHGGSVTALVELAMKEGVIDSAVLTRSDHGLDPSGLFVSRPEDVRQCLGSSFQIPPGLEILNRTLKENRYRKIGVVGTPCKTLAVYKMQNRQFEDDPQQPSRIGMVFGLFCGWGIDWQGLERMVKSKASLERVKHIDIPPSQYGIMEVETADGRIEIPLEEIYPIIRYSCRFCADMTAEFADLSIGGARSSAGWDFDRGWNQIIVRTKRGKELLDLARDRGVLEFREAAPANLDKLKKASSNKKKKAIQAIIEKTGDVNNLLYLDPFDPSLENLLPEMK